MVHLQSTCTGEPDYAEDLPLFKHADKWPKIEGNRRWAVRLVKGLPYRADLESLLLRYISALDQPNPEAALLQLWGILEKLTHTVGAKYDETIKRAVWIFSGEDRLLAKDLLEAVRCRRNQYVHASRTGPDSDQVTYLVKSFVDPHLIRLIRNDFSIKSLDQYGEFLSLPTETAVLRDRMIWLRRALRTRSGSKQ